MSVQRLTQCDIERFATIVLPMYAGNHKLFDMRTFFYRLAICCWTNWQEDCKFTAPPSHTAQQHNPLMETFLNRQQHSSCMATVVGELANAIAIISQRAIEQHYVRMCSLLQSGIFRKMVSLLAEFTISDTKRSTWTSYLALLDLHQQIRPTKEQERVAFNAVSQYALESHRTWELWHKVTNHRWLPHLTRLSEEVRQNQLDSCLPFRGPFVCNMNDPVHQMMHTLVGSIEIDPIQTTLVGCTQRARKLQRMLIGVQLTTAPSSQGIDGGGVNIINNPDNWGLAQFNAVLAGVALECAHMTGPAPCILQPLDTHCARVRNAPTLPKNMNELVAARNKTKVLSPILLRGATFQSYNNNNNINGESQFGREVYKIDHTMVKLKIPQCMAMLGRMVDHLGHTQRFALASFLASVTPDGVSFEDALRWLVEQSVTRELSAEALHLIVNRTAEAGTRTNSRARIREMNSTFRTVQRAPKAYGCKTIIGGRVDGSAGKKFDRVLCPIGGSEVQDIEDIKIKCAIDCGVPESSISTQLHGTPVHLVRHAKIDREDFVGIHSRNK